MYREKTIAAILLMGGSSKRFSPVKMKQLEPLGNAPLFHYALHTFQHIRYFDKIILVCNKDIIAKIETSVTKITGGATRQASVKAALDFLKPNPPDYVLIHDIARPFVSDEIIFRQLEALMNYRAVNTCIASSDTICQVENESIISVPDRSSLRLGQTPQSFSFDLIFKAHETTLQKDASDDCLLVKELGEHLHFIEGSKENFKITTQEDLHYAEYIINNKGTPWQKNSTFTIQQ